MRRGDLALHGEGGDLSPEALRADAERIDAGKRLLLDGGDILARMMAPHFAREGLFGEEGTPVKGGAIMRARRRTVSTTARRMPSLPSAGVSMKRRLMFSLPNPFGRKVTRTCSPSTRSI